MSDDLRTLLARAADAEARRFQADHPGEETSLYERAITPRRRWRRVVEAGGALAVAAVVAVGASVLADVPDAVEPARSTPTPPVATEARELTVPGGTFERDADAEDLADEAGPALTELPGCAELDALARLEGRAETGGEPVRVGALLDSAGGVNGVRARTFSSEAGAADYLRAVADEAMACADGAAGAGVDVVVADVGLVALAGDGVRVEVYTTDGTEPWKTWVHVRGDVGLAVVVSPGARDLAAPIILEWFTGGTEG